MMADLKSRARQSIRPVAAVVAKTGLTPNALTVVGLLLNAGVGAVLALGYLQIGGLLVLLAGAFDALDGAVARATNRVSTFGAFLDSTLDRYSEAVIFLGILVDSARRDDLTAIVLTYAAAVGSLVVSYARARAEGLGLRGEVGLLQRPERVVLLGLGLLAGLLTPTLWVLAILTNLTALQRILHVRKITRT